VAGAGKVDAYVVEKGGRSSCLGAIEMRIVKRGSGWRPTDFKRLGGVG
jgi:hypothetical protein